jgi:hypothetical protein
MLNPFDGEALDVRDVHRHPPLTAKGKREIQRPTGFVDYQIVNARTDFQPLSQECAHASQINHGNGR